MAYFCFVYVNSMSLALKLWSLALSDSFFQVLGLVSQVLVNITEVGVTPSESSLKLYMGIPSEGIMMTLFPIYKKISLYVRNGKLSFLFVIENCIQSPQAEISRRHSRLPRKPNYHSRASILGGEKNYLCLV